MRGWDSYPEYRKKGFGEVRLYWNISCSVKVKI
jgi:hypothetical protein